MYTTVNTSLFHKNDVYNPADNKSHNDAILNINNSNSCLKDVLVVFNNIILISHDQSLHSYLHEHARIGYASRATQSI